jgi:DNA-binding transcriptional LysR family regulator
VNLANLDLNLLVALDALLTQRGVTRAAQQVGLSQPAMSAALSRLRRHFGDDLLARFGNDYRLTPLADRLKEPVRVTLEGAERVFGAQSEFDPAGSTREYSVLMSDYSSAVLGGRLVQLLSEEAPSARLRLAHNAPHMVDRAEQALQTADLMVLPHGFISGLPHTDLYRDSWTCLVSDDNEDVGDHLTVEQVASLSWVAAYYGPTASTAIAQRMRMQGVELNVQVVTESFYTVPALVTGSGRVALIQERLAALLPRDAGVRTVACPLDLEPLVAAMWWHPMYDRDPEHVFLRDLVLRAAHEAAADA